MNLNAQHLIQFRHQAIQKLKSGGMANLFSYAISVALNSSLTSRIIAFVEFVHQMRLGKESMA
jgi:hypothetical protein